jgi:hypothetical protein
VDTKTIDQEKLFTAELQVIAETRLPVNNPHLTQEMLKQGLLSMVKSYEDLLDQTAFLTRINDRLEQRLNTASTSLYEKNAQLRQALTDLAKAQRTKQTYHIIYVMAATLFVFEEVIVDPIANIFETSVIIVIGLKLVVALLLKPTENMLQKMLMKR